MNGGPEDMSGRPGWHGRERLLDTLLAVAVTAIALASALTVDPNVTYHFRDPNVIAVLLAVLCGAPLAVRRRWPVAVAVTVAVAVSALAALRFNPGQTAFCQMIALYTVAAWRRLGPALVGLAASYLGMGLLVALRAPYFNHPLAVVDFAAVTVAWVIGRVARRWRVDREAEHRRAIEAERAGAVAAERAVFAERLHIARELHDVVSHTLTVIAVQAASTRYLLAAADSPLSAIEGASRAALDDLRRMLGLLRAEAPAGQPPPAGQGPPARPVAAAAPVVEWVVDTAMAVALTVLAFSDLFVASPAVAGHYRGPSPGVVALLLLACLPLAVRRHLPVAVLAASATATLLLTVLGARTDVPAFAMLVALYTVAAQYRLAVSAPALAILLATSVLLALLHAPGGGSLNDPRADLAIAAPLIPWALGLMVRRWRRERQAATERVRQAHRDAAVAAQRAVFAERLRIAAELHDVVAHTLSAIAVQSAVARHELAADTTTVATAGPNDPAGTDETAGLAGAALAAIEEASRSALADMRRMLGVLRTPASLSPNPGIDELEVLASAHRVVHGPLELIVDPTVRTAAPSVQVTAYRLVQEALTNVRKHAPGAHAYVHVLRAGTDIVVRIEDDGATLTSRPPHHGARELVRGWFDGPTGRPADGPAGRRDEASGGFGLTGMRERVALFDGVLDAGPADSGGFRIEAILRPDPHNLSPHALDPGPKVAT